MLIMLERQQRWGSTANEHVDGFTHNTIHRCVCYTSLSVIRNTPVLTKHTPRSLLLPLGMLTSMAGTGT